METVPLYVYYIKNQFDVSEDSHPEFTMEIVNAKKCNKTYRVFLDKDKDISYKMYWAKIYHEYIDNINCSNDFVFVPMLTEDKEKAKTILMEYYNKERGKLLKYLKHNEKIINEIEKGDTNK